MSLGPPNRLDCPNRSDLSSFSVRPSFSGHEPLGPPLLARPRHGHHACRSDLPDLLGLPEPTRTSQAYSDFPAFSDFPDFSDFGDFQVLFGIVSSVTELTRTCRESP